MLKSLLIIFLLTYALIMLGMFMFQRRLMYYPVTAILPAAEYGVEHVKVIPLVTEDNIHIEAWHVLQADTTLPLLVYFHGNAGHLGDRMEKLRHFIDAGFGILAVSYRGYGNSKGIPSEIGLYADAKAALEYALKETGLTAQDIILYGESLGSGVATHTAKAMAESGTPVAGLVLEAPYTSVANRAQEMYPFIPARWLARDKYPSITKIAAIHCPLLLFHGEADTVIPVHHGRTLLAAAQEPKRGVFYPGIGHTDFDYDALTAELLSFAREVKPAPAPEPAS